MTLCLAVRKIQSYLTEGAPAMGAPSFSTPPTTLTPSAVIPQGTQPRRDHRFLDRVSRHEVPKTPGNDDAFKVYDPARVSWGG